MTSARDGCLMVGWTALALKTVGISISWSEWSQLDTLGSAPNRTSINGPGAVVETCNGSLVQLLGPRRTGVERQLVSSQWMGNTDVDRDESWTEKTCRRKYPPLGLAV